MRISDWSSDVCSSDLKTETVDPSTFSLGRAANRIFADGASAVFSSAGTPLTRIRLSSNHKGNSYPRDWRVARLDTFLTVSALLFHTQTPGTPSRSEWNASLPPSGDQAGDQLLPLASVRFFFFPRSEEHTSELQSLMRISYA